MMDAPIPIFQIYPEYPRITLRYLLKWNCYPSSGLAAHHKRSGTHNNSLLSCSFSMSIWSVVAPRVVAHANRSTSPANQVLRSLSQTVWLSAGGVVKSVHKRILEKFYPHCFTEKKLASYILATSCN